MDHLSNIPYDMQLTIFSYLDIHSLIALAKVSPYFMRRINDDIFLWEQIKNELDIDYDVYNYSRLSPLVKYYICYKLLRGNPMLDWAIKVDNVDIFDYV